MKKTLITLSMAACIFSCSNKNGTGKPETLDNKENLTASPAKTKADINGLNDIIITRMIDAPVEAVWMAWTDPKQVMRWWGPVDYTSPFCKIDLREGGKYIFCMRALKEQGGQDMYTTGIYKKIVPEEYLEFGQSLSDKQGNPVDPATLNMPPDFPRETKTVLQFKPLGNKTQFTWTEFDWKPGQMRDYSERGINECLDKLEKILAKKNG